MEMTLQEEKETDGGDVKGLFADAWKYGIGMVVIITASVIEIVIVIDSFAAAESLVTNDLEMTSPGAVRALL